MPESDPQAEAGFQPARSRILLAIYVAITGLLFYQQATSWPHEGSWALLGYVFLCPGILFQSFSLAYASRTGRPLARRALTRLATIPLGLLLAGVVSEGGSLIAMRCFERAYEPFIARVEAGMGNLAGPCAQGARYFAIPSVAEHNRRTGSRPTANLHYDGKRFVLGFAGGSADIDGSTIYYDSVAKGWHRFHNDRLDQGKVHAKLIEGLATCKLSAQQAESRPR